MAWDSLSFWYPSCNFRTVVLYPSEALAAIMVAMWYSFLPLFYLRVIRVWLLHFFFNSAFFICTSILLLLLLALLNQLVKCLTWEAIKISVCRSFVVPMNHFVSAMEGTYFLLCLIMRFHLLHLNQFLQLLGIMFNYFSVMSRSIVPIA